MIATTPSVAASVTNRHYDLPPEVFATFLGRRMKYTCGLYRDGIDSLDAAQEAKLWFIATRLGISGGERVLDVGCGWGSLTLFLTEVFDCHVTAVAPSPVQVAYLREQAATRGLASRVRIEQKSVYDLDLPPRAFDAAAIVGAIEHMPDEQQVMHLITRSLRRGGRLYVSASCYRNRDALQEYAARAASRHVTEEIFGDTTMRPISTLVAAMEEAGLSIIGLTDLTGHYERTITAWLDGVHRACDRIDALVPGLAAELIRYFETAQAGWGHTTKHYALTAARSRWGYAEEWRS